MKKNRPFARSQELLDRALRSIPLGTQTFSKSITQYPRGISPHYIVRGAGSRVWDADDNEYIDFVNGLCAVTLGHCDPDVTRAVEEQLHRGVIFSLPHPVEIDVAEIICDLVPCAEMVRFGKNGSDATAGAVRIARAFTGREHIACCGYHGWQDWYIGTTSRNAGVPDATSALTHPFVFNDLDSVADLFRTLPDAIAAVIMEPMNVEEPAPGFLEGVRDLAHENGALLVFDEIITGFRFARGGAQELFGITPDIACFGKGLANGFPLSAVAGRAEVMKRMEDVFFSFTMGGETLSLAAAKATLEKIVREPVIEALHDRGGKLIAGIRALIRRHDAGHVLSVLGHPAWSFLNFADTGRYRPWQINTLYLQEVFARGILSLRSHNMSYAHSDDDIDRLLGAYDEIFPILRGAVEDGTLERQLRCDPLEPLFEVR